jgi:hypothetical protein
MASRVIATWPRPGNREALCFSNVRNIEPHLACGSLVGAQQPPQVRHYEDGWHLRCVAWSRMRIAFNITNKMSGRWCAGNSGREFWRILEAFRRITGGMGTDSYLVRNFRTGDQPSSGPIEAGEAARILLPSPSLQGYGLMCLRSGARPVDCPAALPSQPSSLRSQSCGRGQRTSEPSLKKRTIWIPQN